MKKVVLAAVLAAGLAAVYGNDKSNVNAIEMAFVKGDTANIANVGTVQNAMERGRKFLESGNYDKAKLEYSSVLSSPYASPNDKINSLLQRGNAYNKKGEYNKAVADYNEAIKLTTATLTTALSVPQTAQERQRPPHSTGKTGKPDTRWYDDNSNARAFTISTVDELAGLAKLVNDGNDFSGKKITLVQDIDLSAFDSMVDGSAGGGWIPIGGSWGDVEFAFMGIFDGNGKTISGLWTAKYDVREFDGAGLFGYISGGGTVKNLGVVGANIDGANQTGIVAGTVNGRGIITNCYGTGKVSGTREVGAIAGRVANGSKVLNCYGAAAVSASYDVAGGIAGFVGSKGSVVNCYSAGAVSAAGDMAGGIAGYVMLDGKISDCYSTGKINGKNWIGGIVGMLGVYDSESDLEDNSVVENCYATGAVAGGTCLGGIVGFVMDGSLVANCVALNSSIGGTDSEKGAGRVAGMAKAICLSNNAAFSGMKDGAGRTNWDNKGERNKDGSDLTASFISNYGSIGNRFTEKNGWTTQTGKLPGFGQTVEMPRHLR